MDLGAEPPRIKILLSTPVDTSSYFKIFGPNAVSIYSHTRKELTKHFSFRQNKAPWKDKTKVDL